MTNHYLNKTLLLQKEIKGRGLSEVGNNNGEKIQITLIM